MSLAAHNAVQDSLTLQWPFDATLIKPGRNLQNALIPLDVELGVAVASSDCVTADYGASAGTKKGKAKLEQAR